MHRKQERRAASTEHARGSRFWQEGFFGVPRRGMGKVVEATVVWMALLTREVP